MNRPALEELFKRHKSARIPLSGYLDALRIYFLVQIMEERKIKRQCWQINCKEDELGILLGWIEQSRTGFNAGRLL
jgi:hypothetical protein